MKLCSVKYVENIKIKVYVGGQVVHDSLMEKETALNSNRIPLHEIIGLEFQPVVEGQLMPESGELQTRFCCVDSRKLTTENNEEVVIIHGHWC